ncbi:MAG: non-hydrolyzing UDP-N-acetylglucosamine 2-epimerase [Candidatus Sifarchaeia archaeon]
MQELIAVTVFGTRPEIIKLSSFIEEMDRRITNHFLVHTNQHYDYEMDAIFMDDLELRKPDVRLSVRSRNQVTQLGEMVAQLGSVLRKLNPDVVTVLGDTNSTVAGSIAGLKYGAKVVHIESGCRSHDRTMPEERNRIIVDHASDLLIAPTRTCVQNLREEGLNHDSVHLVGSTLVEVCKRNLRIAKKKASIELDRPFVLVTIHRRGNIEDEGRLRSIAGALGTLSRDVNLVFPLHPHTKTYLKKYGLLHKLGTTSLLPPLGYLDFLKALSEAEFVITDSGGVQQEAQVFNVPTLTARKETEWVETVESGVSVLVDASERKIVQAGRRLLKDEEYRGRMRKSKNPYVEREVSKRIADLILKHIRHRQ